MAVSDAVFKAWLASPTAKRALLVEASPSVSGVVTTRYMSNWDYVSEPSDTPANQIYDSIVSEVPYFSSALSTTFRGKSTFAWGDLLINNDGGARDSWLNDAWDGRALKFLLGDADWVRNDFRTILDGVSADIVANDRSTNALRIRDKSWMLNVPIQTSLIATQPGASGLFDGTGDAISTPDVTALRLGSGDCTIECWVRFNSTSGNKIVMAKADANTSWFIYKAGTGLKFYASTDGSTLDIANAQVIGTVATNTWYHVAVTRSSTTFRAYLSGVQGSTWTSSGTFFPDATAVSIGGSATAGASLDGWVDEARINNGHAYYTGAGAFTPPTGPFATNSADDPYWGTVVSLLHFEGADASTTFTDETGKVWTAAGNAQIDTAQYKYGAPTAYLNQPKPLTFGQPFNPTPVLINAATWYYQFNDGVIYDITEIRDSGVPVSFTKDLANGGFWLIAAPAGEITGDVKGAMSIGSPTTYLSSAADIVREIITTRTLLGYSDLDAAAFNALSVSCPQKLGLYIRDPANVVDIIDQIFESVGAWWTFGQDGKMTVGRFDAAAGSPVLYMNADDVVREGIRIKRRILPVASYSLGYRRNWTPQASGLAGSLTAAKRAEFANEYLTKTATNAGVDTTYLTALDVPRQPTLMVDGAETQTECTRVATLWSVLRYVYSIDSFAVPMFLQLGQEMNLTNDRFGFSAGVNGIVTSMRWSPTKSKASIEEFFV